MHGSASLNWKCAENQSSHRFPRGAYIWAYIFREAMSRAAGINGLMAVWTPLSPFSASFLFSLLLWSTRGLQLTSSFSWGQRKLCLTREAGSGIVCSSLGFFFSGGWVFSFGCRSLTCACVCARATRKGGRGRETHERRFSPLPAKPGLGTSIWSSIPPFFFCCRPSTSRTLSSPCCFSPLLSRDGCQKVHRGTLRSHERKLQNKWARR